MNNVSNGDYGYIHPACIPEPDMVITSDWGQVIAKCTARLLTYGYTGATMAGVTYYAAGTMLGSCNEYDGIPLVKCYLQNGTAWTDQGIAGLYNTPTPQPWYYGDLWIIPNYDTFGGTSPYIGYEWGYRGGIPPSSRTDVYMILVAGK